MITTKVENIDARRAKLYLDSPAAPNRKILHAVVNRYARDMEAGNWRLTGQPIIFDSQERLLDGRHRLTAVVKAGARAQILVVRGIDPDAMHSIDTGRARTPGQILGLLGVGNSSLVASIARTVFFLEHAGAALGDSVSVDEITATIDAHRGIRWIVGQRGGTGTGVITTTSVLAAFGLAWELHPEVLSDYWRAFHSGAGLDVGDPLLTLRNVLLSPTARTDQLTRTRTGRFALARATLTLIRARLLGKHRARMPGGNDKETTEAVEYFTGQPARPVNGKAATAGTGT